MILIGIEEYYQMIVKDIVLIRALGADINLKRSSLEGNYE